MSLSDAMEVLAGTRRYAVIEGDCLEILPTLGAASVDAIVTDPPFFCPAQHYAARVKWSRKCSDMSILAAWWRSVCVEFARVIKPTGHVLTFCNADSYAVFYPAMFERWELTGCLVWDKGRPGLGRSWRHQHELIIAARNAGAWEPDDNKARPDVILCPVTPSVDRDHPVEKPDPLLRTLIATTCPPDGLVLDAFSGSGTTLVAAIRGGRRAIGIELDGPYAQASRDRLAAESEGSTLAARRSGQLPLLVSR